MKAILQADRIFTETHHAAMRNNHLLVVTCCILCSCLSTWKDAPDSDTTIGKLDTGGGTDMSNCPAASGFPVRTNILHGGASIWFFYPTLGAQHNGSLEYYSHAGQTPWESWWVSASGPEDIGLNGDHSFDVECTNQGYFALGGGIYFILQLWNSEGTGDDNVSLAYTFDPPMLILPAEPAVGVSWDISSTRTFESYTGYVWSDLYEDHREIVAQETLPITISIVGDDPTEVVAWRVETAHGQTLYYADNYGLVQADDRQVYGTNATPGED